MGWFNKKEVKRKSEGLPQLPELPELKSNNLLSQQDLPGSPQGLSEPETPQNLPPLPSLEPQEKSNQEVIKQEINQPPQTTESAPSIQLPPQNQISKQTELENDTTSGFSKSLISQDSQPKSSTKETEPIYVRLDKFKTAVETFDEIKNKITEIENLLRKTKEIKIKEEQELEEWEKEIHLIKTRMESIDKNIFNKLD